MIKKNNIWLIGAGTMSQEYAKILSTLKLPFEVIGRSNRSKINFQKLTGKIVNSGELRDNIIKIKNAPKKAIVAVGVDKLKEVAIDLINFGVKEILLEKPGGLTLNEIKYINNLSRRKKTKIFIGYNRRFYQSVKKMKEMIVKDNGIISINFEFTEFSSQIKKLKKNNLIKKNWLLANSSHVIDLVFYLAGRPKNWNYYFNGKIAWHPSSARFSGSGITNKGIMFSYHSDWQAPGSWRIEVLTKKNRFILKPMEKLHVVKNIFSIKSIKIKNNLDKDYKPGLFLQTKNFIEGNFSSFCSLSEQVKNVEIYSKMAGYK